jgi:hypothetical protein
MKRVLAAVSAVLIIAALLAVLLAEQNYFKPAEKNEAYVGVAYGGETLAEGKLLIDRVKSYTNLFVLQSGSLQRNLSSVDELGDYAVSAGLHFLPYFGHFIEPTFSLWLENAKERWGTHLLGVYYADEPGGKMLDDYVKFEDEATGDSITKTRYGDIVVQKPDGVWIHYEISSIIHLYEEPVNENGNSSITEEGTGETEEPAFYATFYPNGTVSGQISNRSSYTTYEQLMSMRPFKDADEAANRFIARDQGNIRYLKNNSIRVFTSDYALYWFDYLAGYDVLLAQTGWNISLNQQIAQVRGAAELQHRDWGMVVTWKYDRPPYLDSGPEILSQLRSAYEAGAEYLVLFDYYEGEGSPYGTMQDEHFQALEDFWKLMRNSEVIQGSVKAEAVLVLPKNYGWGMRYREDKVWGIFKPDEKTQHLWNLLQTALENHDSKLDIAYEDTEFPLTAEYQYTYHGSQDK